MSASGPKAVADHAGAKSSRWRVPLRIVQVHTLYQNRGGEDSAAETEAQVLSENGVTVERVIFDNRDIAIDFGISASLRAAVTTTWSTSASNRLARVLDRVHPDLVHFHNTFPIASPAVVRRASRMGYPVVVTLHNYRLGCLNALLYRNGSPCLECVGHAPWRGVIHACYRQSRGASLAVACNIVTHRVLRTWRDHVDLFLIPSSFASRVLQQMGLRGDRIVVKPNIVGWEAVQTPEPADYFVMVGRLVEDKGIADVVAAWATFSIDAPLRVVGDGPMLGPIKERCDGSRVEFLGSLPRQDVAAILRGARALIFASRWYEVQPMAILEAMACGAPVIAPSGGAAEELVVHGQTGLLYRPGDWQAFADHVRLLSDDRALARQMGMAAAARYNAEYSTPVLLQATLRAYERAIAARQFRGAPL